ncbi:lipopolysaccharide biosynthesis protein [Mucilaginibacter psychrotolerans]|uniref:Lipopolysaccharide biosynthesis protein n=1 Tax=Mucilaginibacter psychrotolerans TaxID=1524096 RepID=A0A4Y8SLD8_9SPHI|nr:oligosaccharide flippase family protein [Mucilaginibacter psychrotolerans]TFF39244.1 lipopolysaccharide biosynthesis protein [Mucilaginibacter psychrotolerans]
MSFLKKIINKHTINLANSAAMPVIGMLVLSLLARKLAPRDFGNYIFFLQTFLLADMFRTGFLQTSLVKFYSGAARDRANNVAGSAWVVGFILTFSLAFIDLILYLVVKSNNTDLEDTLKWFGIIYMTTLPSAVAGWILQAEERFDRLFFLQILNQGGFLIFVLISIYLKHVSFETVIYSYLGTNIITSAVTISKGWSHLHTIKHKTVASMKELANFGKYSVGTSLGSTLLRSSDTFIIKMMFPTALVGIYYIPQRLMEIFEIPMRSFVSTALPELSTAAQRNDKAAVAQIMKRYGGLLTVLLLPVAVGGCILGGLVIHLLFGDKFANTDAFNIFRIFMCYVIIMPIDRFFGITLDILNKPHLNMAKVFLMLIVNVIGDFAGIAIFHNLYGVAIASLFTYYTGVLFGYFTLKKHLDFSLNDLFSLGIDQLKEMKTNLFHKNKPKTT